MNQVLLSVLTGFSLLCSFAVSDAVFASPPKSLYYIFHGDLYREGRAAAFDLNGQVLAVHNASNGLFYLKKMRGKYYTGLLHYTDDKPSFELSFTDIDPDVSIKRFFVNTDSAFVLIDGENEERQLLRLSFNTGDVYSKEGVIDAQLAGDELILLENTADETILNCNGRLVPCACGTYAISEIVEQRLAVLKNMNKKSVEIIDIQAGRNIYAFSPGVSYKMPEQYNLLFETLDDDHDYTAEIPGENDMVYYKLFINGIETGRTETGIPPERKYFNAQLKTGEYYIITPERWELDRKKEEYVRANNIQQPKPIRIYIPENRIINLLLYFDGKEYRFESSAVKE